jgi:hypothetical protein
VSEVGGSLFSPEDQRALASVLDAIIPPSADGLLPGAGQLGLVRAIEDATRRAPDLRTAIDHGLSALRDLLARRGAEGLAALPAEDRRALLDELVAAQPAFLPGLIFHAYVAYYADDRVVEGLGLEARPPHPKGYEMLPSDLGLLDEVRQRAKLYRET